MCGHARPHTRRSHTLAHYTRHREALGSEDARTCAHSHTRPLTRRLQARVRQGGRDTCP